MRRSWHERVARQALLKEKSMQRLRCARLRSSFHSVECLLQELQVGGIASFLTRAFDPFLLQRIFRRPIVLVKDAPFDSAQGWLRRDR